MYMDSFPSLNLIIRSKLIIRLLPPFLGSFCIKLLQLQSCIYSVNRIKWIWKYSEHVQLRVLHDLLISQRVTPPSETAIVSGSDVKCSLLPLVVNGRDKTPASKDNKDDIRLRGAERTSGYWNLPLVMNIVKTQRGSSTAHHHVGKPSLWQWLQSVQPSPRAFFFHHALSKSCFWGMARISKTDFLMSLRFNNLTLIHPFISVLNAAPLGHCLRIIHNQIRSPIKFRIKSAVMLWPFLRQHPSKVPVVPVLTLWVCRDEPSCNVLLNEASNLVVGQWAAIWTSAGVKDGQPEPPTRRIWGTCHAGVMSKVTSLISMPGNARVWTVLAARASQRFCPSVLRLKWLHGEQVTPISSTSEVSLFDIPPF